MNFEEMEKEFNQLMKHGQELIEKLKRGQKTESDFDTSDFDTSDFDVYEINFNGKTERFHCSKQEMTFKKAQELIQKVGKKPLTVSELWAEDNSGIPRWQLLKDAGCKKWVWCQQYSDDTAYFVYLHTGCVFATSTRTSNLTALCL